MTVSEYLRLAAMSAEEDGVYRVAADFREIAERWEKMEEALEDCERLAGSEWMKCDIQNTLAAARTPLGEKTDQD